MFIFLIVIVAEFRGATGKSNLLGSGSLEDLLEATTDESKRRIINGLDFPMGHMSLIPPTQFR
jgi:hypothetical protein